MKDNQTNSNVRDITDGDLIDTINLLKIIWLARKLIIKTTIAFFIIGCIIAISSPVEYTAQTTFVPQVSGDDMSTNKLGSLASIAGINLNASEVTSDSYLSPLLYKNIIDSEEFSLKLLNEELINTNAEKFTIKEYLSPKKGWLNFNPISLIKKYTIGLFLNNNNNEIDNFILENYNFINPEDYSLIFLFRSKFSVQLNEKEGYIKVFASDKDAFISSQLVQKITKSLQGKIIEVRTNKIKERLEFSKEQYDLKQAEFDFLQKKLAEFKDSNKNISTARFLSELQKLESEYQLQQSILINLASEFNNNKIKLNKDTPIFSVIDEVSVPNSRSKPNRGLIVITYVFLGLVIVIAYVLLREPVLLLIKKIID